MAWRKPASMPAEIPSEHPDGELPAIEKVAAEWMIRRDRGLDVAQEAELTRWLQADERHEQVFGALDATWDLISNVRSAAQPQPRRSAFSRVRRRPKTKDQRPKDHQSTLAVPSRKIMHAEEQHFEGLYYRDSLTDPEAAHRWEWKAGWIAPLLAAAATIAVGIFWVSARMGDSRGTDYVTSAQTTVGAWRELILPDRSVVQINTDSDLKVQYTRNERRVLLHRGEAHFTVVKNPARPFVVVAGDVEMRAIGTAFNVRLRSSSVELLVTEGAVRVAPPAAPVADANQGPRADSPPSASMDSGVTSPVVVAGQRLIVPQSPSPQALTATPPIPASLEPQVIRQALAWQSRRLDFESTPLPEIVAEINRYNRQKLVIRDPQLETRRFGGSFPAGDYETFVRLLETNFRVSATRKGDEIHLRLAP